METVKNIVLGFCTAAVFLGALGFLAPEGGTKKSVKYAISLIFLCSTVALFTGLGKISLPNAKNNEPKVEYYGMGEAAVKTYVEAALKDEKIEYKKISVETNITEGGDIYIKKITVYSSGNAKRIIGIIKNTVQTENVEVINE